VSIGAHKLKIEKEEEIPGFEAVFFFLAVIAVLLIIHRKRR
jgi:hypothetical protein